jgi:hypothetical protein
VARRLFAPLVQAGAAAYSRPKDLPRLIALWPREIDDQSHEGRLKILAKLRSALRAERRRAMAGHWSYDLNRHLGLLGAYRGELAALGKERLKNQPTLRRRGAGVACGAKRE